MALLLSLRLLPLKDDGFLQSGTFGTEYDFDFVAVFFAVPAPAD